MTYSTRFSSTRPARSTSRLVARLTVGLLLMVVACANGDDFTDDFVDPGLGAGAARVDAGAPGNGAATYPVADAAGAVPVVDAGSWSQPVITAPSDAGTKPSVTFDAGGTATDAGRTTPDAGGGLIIPDLFGDAGFSIPDLFPASDAGSTPPRTDGGRDVNGPCKDLNLICFDFIDMFINAECFTCNAGKGCQGCAIPFAY